VGEKVDRLGELTAGHRRSGDQEYATGDKEFRRRAELLVSGPPQDWERHSQAPRLARFQRKLFRCEGLDSCGRRKSARGPTPHTGLFPSFPQVLIDKNLRHPVDRVCTGVQVAIRQTPCDRAHVRGRFHPLL
jgi:hypothetical protein